jgi:hypothetical protein
MQSARYFAAGFDSPDPELELELEWEAAPAEDAALSDLLESDFPESGFVSPLWVPGESGFESPPLESADFAAEFAPFPRESVA